MHDRDTLSLCFLLTSPFTPVARGPLALRPPKPYIRFLLSGRNDSDVIKASQHESNMMAKDTHSV